MTLNKFPVQQHGPAPQPHGLKGLGRGEGTLLKEAAHSYPSFTPGTPARSKSVRTSAERAHLNEMLSVSCVVEAISSKREAESMKVVIIHVFIIRPVGRCISFELWVNG